VPHHYPARVARQALGRSSWNARAVFEDGLARLIRVRQDFGVDVDHHLVALARGAGVDAVVEGGLRRLFASPLIQGLAGGGQRLHEQRARK